MEENQDDECSYSGVMGGRQGLSLLVKMLRFSISMSDLAMEVYGGRLSHKKADLILESAWKQYRSLDAEVLKLGLTGYYMVEIVAMKGQLTRMDISVGQDVDESSGPGTVVARGDAATAVAGD